MVTNQSDPSLNRGASLNFWWLKNSKYMKFTEDCVMCTEKHVLVKKMFTNCHYKPEAKKPSMEWKQTDSLLKNSFGCISL